MSAATAPDATALVMDSAPGFTSLLEAAGTSSVARWENAWTNATWSNQPTSQAAHAQPFATAFDNRPTWDNPTPAFDNRPTWDDWNKSK
ncbi:multiple cyclophane-containing RiPP AmcA [Streptomyces sp. NBC_00158]|uniref:multiple cyclophane-containing RiPP AmcA n=1 Tax=Streptomyces sp. NBC_00158 TaxID=2903627 RepID=UPI00324FB08F